MTLLKVVGELQLGKRKVTLNHLVTTYEGALIFSPLSTLTVLKQDPGNMYNSEIGKLQVVFYTRAPQWVHRGIYYVDVTGCTGCSTRILEWNVFAKTQSGPNKNNRPYKPCILCPQNFKIDTPNSYI